MEGAAGHFPPVPGNLSPPSASRVFPNFVGPTFPDKFYSHMP